MRFGRGVRMMLNSLELGIVPCLVRNKLELRGVALGTLLSLALNKFVGIYWTDYLLNVLQIHL